MTAESRIRLGASLGAWQPADVVSKLQAMARLVPATTLYPYPWNLPTPRDVLREIRHASRDLGLTLLVHGPCWEVYTASVYPAVRALAVEAMQRAVDWASAIGAVHLTAHPGLNQWPDVWPHMERQALDAQAESLRQLAAYAQAAGVGLGVENMPLGSGSFRGYIDLTEIERILGTVPYLGVTLDVAHLHTAGMDIGLSIRRLSFRINHVHVTDNCAQVDSHLAVGEGTVPWRPVIQALREIGYSGVLEIERSLADGGVESSVNTLRQLLQDCSHSEP